MKYLVLVNLRDQETIYPNGRIKTDNLPNVLSAENSFQIFISSVLVSTREPMSLTIFGEA